MGGNLYALRKEEKQETKWKYSLFCVVAIVNFKDFCLQAPAINAYIILLGIRSLKLTAECLPHADIHGRE